MTGMRSDFFLAKYRPQPGLPQRASERCIERQTGTVRGLKKFAEFHHKNYFPLDSDAVYKISVCSPAAFFVADKAAPPQRLANSLQF
jgi:hypothetical protein